MKHGDGSQTGEVLPDPEDAKKNSRQNENKAPMPRRMLAFHTRNHIYVWKQAMNIIIKSLHRTVSGNRIGKRRSD